VRMEAGAARFIVFASPGYWRESGMPQQPSDLERHNCLAIRALDGTIWASHQLIGSTVNHPIC
jgi:hypothetical protein